MSADADDPQIAERMRQEAVIDGYVMFKSRGWRAFCPPPKGVPIKDSAAIVLIGSKADGWSRVVTLRGPDRFVRANELAMRYNGAASVVTKIKGL